MYRMTISIPDDLKKRMDRQDKTKDTNWSAIAQRAFAKHMIEKPRDVFAELDDLRRRMEVQERLNGD